MFSASKEAFLYLITSSLFIAAFFPALQLLLQVWVDSPDYSHAFLILPIIFCMFWSNRHLLVLRSDKLSAWGLGLAIVSSIFYLFSLLTQVQSLIFFFFLLTTVGSFVFLFGGYSLVTFFTPLFLFVLLIPIPEQLYIQLTFPLQLMVSQASEAVIRLLEIPIFRQGNVIHIPSHSFEVIEACSGLRSIVSLMNLGVVMGYFMLGRKSSKICLFAASVPVSMLANIFRIVMMIVIYHYFQIDLSKDLMHTVLGLMIFGVALVIFFLLERMLERWESVKK